MRIVPPKKLTGQGTGPRQFNGELLDVRTAVINHHEGSALGHYYFKSFDSLVKPIQAYADWLWRLRQESVERPPLSILSPNTASKHGRTYSKPHPMDVWEQPEGERHEPAPIPMSQGPSIPSISLPPVPVVLPVTEASDVMGPPGPSGREREVLARLAQGQSCIDIAACLGISVKTVSTYRSRLLDKLQLSTTGELIRYAIKNEADLPVAPPPAQATPPPVIASPVVRPMMPAPMPIVRRSRKIEREEWPG